MADHDDRWGAIASHLLSFGTYLAASRHNFNMIRCTAINSSDLGHTPDIYVLHQVSDIGSCIMCLYPYLIVADAHLM